MEQAEYLKPTELAKLLKIHRKTVYKLLKKGELPAFHFGRSWRFSRAEIDKYIAKRSVNNANQTATR